MSSSKSAARSESPKDENEEEEKEDSFYQVQIDNELTHLKYAHLLLSFRYIGLMRFHFQQHFKGSKKNKSKQKERQLAKSRFIFQTCEFEYKILVNEQHKDEVQDDINNLGKIRLSIAIEGLKLYEKEFTSNETYYDEVREVGFSFLIFRKSIEFIWNMRGLLLDSPLLQLK